MIINLTQHQASAEQAAVGVIDLSPTFRATLSALLTFDAVPTQAMLQERADAIWSLIEDADHQQETVFMIGGAPFFMSALESMLIAKGCTPCYAFTQRISTEVDGVKTSVFKHEGFYTVHQPAT